MPKLNLSVKPLGRGKTKGTWDTGVEYGEAEEVLTSLLKELRKKKGEQNEKRFVKTAIVLTQFRNGSRVSEAIEAMQKFAKGEGVMEIQEGVKAVEVRVRKRKDGKARIMILPKEITNEDLLIIRRHIDKMYPELITMFTKKLLKTNTHGFRHSWTTFQAGRGVSPAIIATAQGRSTLDSLLRYIQRKAAEKMLVESVLLSNKLAKMKKEE